MLAELTYVAFEQQLHTTFELQLNPQEALPLELTQIELAPRPGPGRRGFSLIFASDRRGHLPQRTYSLVHPVLGALDLFLVPIGADAVGMQYQAIFG